jgi:hypothetical protein
MDLESSISFSWVKKLALPFHENHRFPDLFKQAFILCFLGLSLVWVYRLYLHPLRHYPGTVLSSISDWPLYFQAISGDLHLEALQKHQTHGMTIICFLRPALVMYNANIRTINRHCRTTCTKHTLPEQCFCFE